MGATRFFHGGNGGLRIGEYILPASVTGAESASDFANMRGLHRKDRCYVTTAIDAAQLFASAAKDPVVYEVELEGNLEDDPDCKTAGHSYACEKAKIIAVHKIRGKLIKKARKELLRRGARRV